MQWNLGDDDLLANSRFATFQIFFVNYRSIFVPVFLNCWLAKITLENILVSKLFLWQSFLMQLVITTRRQLFSNGCFVFFSE
jgi:hypothetical protein